MGDDDQIPFSHDINKRPNKRSHTRGRIIQPSEHAGISKPQLKNPTWNSYKREWNEQVSPLKEEEEEEEDNDSNMPTSEIHGNVGTGIQISRMVSRSKITPWRKHLIEHVHSRRHSRQSRQPSHSRQSRRPSHPRPLGEGGRRSTHKHKRKNKHTRRRVQRRRRA